jgi:betaine reductase
MPVLRSSAFCLSHVPDLVRYGSKPWRETARDPAQLARLASALRDDAAAVAYAPNQVFVGNLDPRDLLRRPRPWFERGDSAAPRRGPFGEVLDQESFLALLACADVLDPPLFALAPDAVAVLADRLARHPLLARHRGARLAPAPERARVDTASEDALPIRAGALEIGAFHRDARAEGRDDPNLGARNLLEALCAKASGALALEWLLHRAGIPASDVDFVISCGEEAVGDRYQRGGGGMAKAIGELCGCTRASGMDVKNFCAGPASALVTAGALVAAGLFRCVAVVGGGSLAKLGMKFEALVARGMPILEDCLASMAFLVTPDDGRSPRLRLEPGAVGVAPIGASGSDEAIYRSLVLAPLERLGLRFADVDRFAPELHNPEIMELAGSGDVAHKNYRAIAALAVLAGQLEKREMDAFVERVGMPGFAPTQGHVPSGVAYLGHAGEALRRRELRRVHVVSKASLFLGRCTELYDGVSFLLEENRGC